MQRSSWLNEIASRHESDSIVAAMSPNPIGTSPPNEPVLAQTSFDIDIGCPIF
jgi:hypothetical protein